MMEEDKNASPAYVDEAELSQLGKRPQMWGTIVRSVVQGVECHINIPKEYGSNAILSRWPCLVYLSESPFGHYNGFEHSNSSGWFVQGADDDPELTNAHRRRIPFVIVSPTPAAEKKWSEQIEALQTAMMALRNSLYISARRMHLVGVGDGADAIFNWQTQYPGMFAAFVFGCSSQLHKLMESKWSQPCRILVDTAQTSVETRDDVKRMVDEQEDDELIQTIYVQSGKVKNKDERVDGNQISSKSYVEVLRNPELYAWLMEISKPIDLCGGTKPSQKKLYEELAVYVGDREGYYSDVYGVGAGLQQFEENIATMLGKKSGCFVTTGTCANQMAVRTAADMLGSKKSQSDGTFNQSTGSLLMNRGVAVRAKDESRTVLVHWTSHLVHLTHLFDCVIQREAFVPLAKKNLFGLNIVPCGSLNKTLTIADLQKDLHKWKTPAAAIVIEIPQRMNGGATMSFEDLRKLRAICQERKIHMHMDGARLWEVQPYYGRSLSEICSMFDSVYVSFYKGLGSCAGAMLVGDEDFMNRAKAWRHRLGGQPYTFAPAWIDSERMLNLNKGTFQARFERMCRVVELMKDEMIVYPGGLVKLVPEVPQSCMIHVYLRAPMEVAVAAHEKSAQMSHVRLWNKIRGTGFSTFLFPEGDGCYFEWTMGNDNSKIDLSEIVEGWNAFLGILHLAVKQHGARVPNRPRRISASPSRSFVQRSLFTNWTGVKTKSERSEELAFPTWRPPPLPIGKMGSLNASSPDMSHPGIIHEGIIHEL